MNIESLKADVSEKIPFYLQMWFIVIVTYFTTFMLCIPGIALFIIRIKKYPSKRKIAWIVLGRIAAMFISIVGMAVFFAVKDDIAIDKYIKKEDYNGALEYVEDNITYKSLDYYTTDADREVYRKYNEIQEYAELQGIVF